ncbi:hypothetical protein LCGC14_2797790 [marine sediment metagenome]|uniref:Uncharacterized protein n=1 Tax=marine sediment metagenome TaxID=412755 RepID=A0A0F9AXA8_9ZZZZ
MKKEKKHIIPRWLFYTCAIIFASGMTQIIVGQLIWGITLEKNIAIIITFLCSGIVLFDLIMNLLKYKIKIV